jgi:uroporphyrinogen III methyltransferase/synthase
MSEEAKRRGRVILVGAGPGDPDLITLRGLKALQSADSVVYDALASSELLEHVSPSATLHNVGKRGHDEPTRTQPETTALLIELANAGDVVVRLKGGDPFVFGRGGEEATACAVAGIEFEVIPGISSSVAALAYAGIPITDRRLAASFAVVTGHKDPSTASDETRWGELATAVDTLVILMGMQNLAGLVGEILAGGHPPDTPAAVVMNGTLPSQRVVRAPLCDLPQAVVDQRVGAPAAVVIGDVVRLREELAWFERRPLFGCRVLVTRAADQQAELVAALREAGAEPIVVPMIRPVPPEDFAPLDAALERLAGFDALLLTSANAVRFLAARAAERDIDLRAAPPAACVGPATAEQARRAGLTTAWTPQSRYDAEGLLEALSQRAPLRGQRFLLPQAEHARPVLAEGLRAAGAIVETPVAYRTVAADIDREALRDRLLGGELDALTFTSPSTVRHFVAGLDDESRKAAAECWIAAIGPVTANALRGVGLAPDAVPERAGMRELVTALGERVGRGGKK